MAATSGEERKRGRARPAARWLVAATCMAGVACAIADSDPLVARVNDTPIHLSDVYRHIETRPLGEQIDYRENLERFVAAVVREEVLFQFALGEALGGDSALREEIKELVVERLIEQRVRAQATVSEEEAARYYEENPSQVRGEHWRVWHIPMEQRPECDAVAGQIESRESFTALAAEHSSDPGLAARGGDMGYVMRHHNVLGLGTLLHRLPTRTPFVFESQAGCHVLWVDEHVLPPLPPYEEVAERMRVFLQRRREGELLRSLLREAEKAVTVERMDPDGGDR